MIRAMLVDDERLARAVLRRMIEQEHPDVAVVVEAESVRAAAEALARESVDLIFLDVQMPGEDGFALFDRVDVDAHVVFVTAWDQHAVRAFEVHALDYLLKPVSPERLAATLERVRAKERPSPALAEEGSRLELDELACLPTRTGMRFFRIREITHLTAAGDYVEVHLGKDALLSNTPLRTWEARLPDDFVRVHRSTLVNLAHVAGVIREGSAFAVQIHGRSEPVAMSRRHAARLQEELGRKLR